MGLAPEVHVVGAVALFSASRKFSLSLEGLKMPKARTYNTGKRWETVSPGHVWGDVWNYVERAEEGEPLPHTAY